MCGDALSTVVGAAAPRGVTERRSGRERGRPEAVERGLGTAIDEQDLPQASGDHAVEAVQERGVAS
jgi:hypothetical protein